MVRELAGIFHGTRAFTGPRFVQIDVTNRCDNECILCWGYTPLAIEEHATEGWKRWANSEIPVDLVKNLIHDLYEMDTQLIHFAGGGEPFFHPQVMEILRYVKSLGLQCKVTSNFTKIEEQQVRELAELPIDYLTLSFWAASEETYQVTHPKKKPGTFTKIAGNLRNLCELRKEAGKPWILIYNVISKLNYHEIERMYDFGLEVGVDAVEYQIIDPVPGVTEHFLMSPEEAEKAVELVDRVIAKNCVNKNKLVLIEIDSFRRRLCTKDVVTGNYDQELADKIPCYIAWDFARVLGNGDVASCLKSDKTPIGNLYQNKFSELWNSPPQQQFRYNAVHLSKSDPYFAKTLCHKTCDNMGDNIILQQKQESLLLKDRTQYILAKTCAVLLRRIRSSNIRSR
jgi:MoaA/NifB/PqqE/SkfB family radical SAM enzyme